MEAHFKITESQRDDERMARAKRGPQLEESLGEACSASLKRLVRTRMLGVVGRVTGDGDPYPIRQRCEPTLCGVELRLYAAAPQTKSHH
jgi:hypothetical protein